MADKPTNLSATSGDDSPFEKIRRVNAAGNEHWSSRDFAKVLGYTDYRNFEQVIEKARLACFNSGQRVDDHFVDITEMVEIGSSARRPIKTTLMSRYACYLAIQNADPRRHRDVKQSKPAPYIERVIVKTIAAFLNTDGGTLVIGVEDNGNIYGLAEDYKISGNKGRDGFELWLMPTLLKNFGKDAAGQISLSFHDLTPVGSALRTIGESVRGADPTQTAASPVPAGSGDVCIVRAKASPAPRFVVENGQELFYIRTGNATNGLKPSEMIAYCKQKWPDALGAA